MRALAVVAGVLRRNVDLSALLVLLVALQPLIPSAHVFARADLLGWLALCLAACAALRGRALDDGPHPQLVARRSEPGRLTRVAARALAPFCLVAAHDLAWRWSWETAYTAVGLLAATAGLRLIGRRHGLTAWRPPGTLVAALWWGLLGGALLLMFTLGVLRAARPGSALLAGLTLCALAGFGFAGVGVMATSPRDLAQRLAAGVEPTRALRLEPFVGLLAVTGPAIGLAVLLVVQGALGFESAWIVALHVVVWTGVIWPRVEPTVKTVLLHEVTPHGGRDRASGAASAVGFEETPEGALRISPLSITHLRVVHPWVVPVRADRIASLDDPVRTLWPRRAPWQPQHVLGDAAFEVNPHSRRIQLDTITVHLSASESLRTLRSGASQAYRLVVLRPFPAAWRASEGRRLNAYRWEEALPSEAVQVVDAAVDSITLRDGDLIVASAEGVAYVYEVHLGVSLVLPSDLRRLGRVPQLEDYIPLEVPR